MTPVGRVTSGPHRGMFVQVERDASGTGWHIWLLERWPPPAEGFDIWADDQAQLDAWLGPDHLAVDWLPEPPVE